MKKFLVASLITLSTSVNAWGQSCYSHDSCFPCCAEGCYFEVYGEYLLWKVVQDQLQYAMIVPGQIANLLQMVVGNTLVNIDQTISLIEPSFKPKAGFEIGANYKGPNGFAISFSWTRLHEKIHSHVINSGGGILTLGMPFLDFIGFQGSDDPQTFLSATRANSSWHFAFDELDLEFTTSCHIGCCEYSPYIGVKALAIKQKQFLEYLGLVINNIATIAQSTTKNHFKAIGPSLGMAVPWQIWKGLSLCADINFTLLYGNFHVSQSPLFNFPPDIVNITFKNSYKNRIRPAIDVKVGLDWAVCSSDNIGIDLGVFYEVQYFWNQWQSPRSIVDSILVGGPSPQGDLMMYGLTAHAGLSF